MNPTTGVIRGPLPEWNILPEPHKSICSLEIPISSSVSRRAQSSSVKSVKSLRPPEKWEDFLWRTTEGKKIYIPGKETCLKCLLNWFDRKVYKSEISPFFSHNGTKTDANLSGGFGFNRMFGDFLNFAMHFKRFSSESKTFEENCELPRWKYICNNCGFVNCFNWYILLRKK